MNFKILGISLLSALALSACSGNGNNATEEPSPVVNEEINIKELVQDYSLGNIPNHTAAITSQQLIVTDSDGNEIVYELPEEEFFVSIAPYVDQTHP